MPETMGQKTNIVLLPNGLGDAIQTLPVLQLLERLENTQTVVIAEKQVHALFIHIFGIRAMFLARDEFTAGAMKRSRFDAMLDFNGLNQPSFEELPHYSFDQTVGHTLFKDKKIKTGTPCIKVNGIMEESRFFNAIGYPPKPAWTQYHEMFAKLFPELTFQPDLKGFPYKYPQLGNQSEHSRSYGFIPCGSLRTKHWPISRYIELAARFEGEGYKIHFYLGETERAYAKDIAEKLIDPAIEVNLSLQELAVNLQQHKIVIANDCGPMHVAAAIGCPLIAIFRDTLPQCWFPYQKANQIVIGGQLHTVYRGGRADISWPEVAEVKNSADSLTRLHPKAGRLRGLSSD
jgi:ADP-heptose:LPS heptosyltransferase